MGCSPSARRTDARLLVRASSNRAAPCDFCASTGNELLRALRRKGVARQRRVDGRTFWQATGLPAEPMGDLPEGFLPRLPLASRQDILDELADIQRERDALVGTVGDRADEQRANLDWWERDLEEQLQEMDGVPSAAADEPGETP
jgi:hypothetical protein